eukprot:Gregarina_sp_Pseudo_9__171@NODE_1112_length_1868_cov_11_885730_g1039_i0_p1_GENE_NODE_1112_length_1868_cov_11_885730_g1039_i0NODE_1112_length_1868_cov_11_885730_g1039_i0_p1_ORF_typecomplete_len577_score10_68DUF21/PF01595_20/8_3e39CBS/PF00571_28/8_6e02CBS/PF00571_28/0_00014PyocinActivator/PF11112_8/0_0018_NODE_1112_length_1868_cov_11_885730_g1039_i0271757
MTAAFTNVSAHAESLATWKIVLAVCLAIGSAISAGLTLGFMTMDLVQLKVLMNSESCLSERRSVKTQRDYARAVYPLREKGTLLLITLLMTNVGVNAAFSILLGDVTSGLVGFFLSTSVLTVFGEILPQAVCSRYALPICYWFIPIVLAMEFILFPLAWPLSKLLDAFLGKELGVVYTRDQLNFLLHHHGSEANVLTPDEIQLLGGSLRLHRIQAGTIMIPLSRVFGLYSCQLLDKATLAQIISSGYSRFPVFRSPDQQNVTCFLHLKDLALINPKHYISVDCAADLLGRHMVCTKQGITLLNLLAVFSDGRSRISLVIDESDNPLGIVTMDDIFHQILQTQSDDEFTPVINGGHDSMGLHNPLCPVEFVSPEAPSMSGISVPLEPSMSYVQSKILSRRVLEDDVSNRTARLQLLTECCAIESLSCEQCFVIHTFLLRRLFGFIVPPIDPLLEKLCLQTLQEARLNNYLPCSSLEVYNGPCYLLILKGYITRQDKSELLGSWNLLRFWADSGSTSCESVLSMSTEDTKDWSPTKPSIQFSKPLSSCPSVFASGEEGCTTLTIDGLRFREAYGCLEM